MMKIGNEEVSSHMTIEYDFPGIRVFDAALQPTTWHISMDVVAMEVGPNATTAKMQENGSKAFQKIYFWLDAIMPGVVVIDPKNKDSMGIAAIIDNTMLYCPDEPTDNVLIQLIHAKLSAITRDALYIGEMRMTSTDTSATYTFSNTDAHSYLLPKTIKEYCGMDATDTTPWWFRNDGFCFEFLKPESMSEDAIIAAYSQVEDPLKTFDDAYAESNVLIEPDQDDSPAEIIEVPAWQPTTVD